MNLIIKDKEENERLRYRYTFAEIQEEVYKRTSMLARGENSIKYNELVFSKGEDFIFMPYLYDVAGELFDFIVPFCRRKHSIFDDENTPEIAKGCGMYIVPKEDVKALTVEDVTLDYKITNGMRYFDAETNVWKIKEIDAEKKQAYATVNISLDKYYKDTLVLFSTDLKYVITKPNKEPEHLVIHSDIKLKGANSINKTIVYPIEDWDPEDLVVVEDIECTLALAVNKEIDKAPEETKVFIGNNMYIKRAEFEYEPADDIRDSVIYDVLMLDWFDRNAIKMTDIAIKEALVNGIIHHWLAIYGDNEISSRYLVLYDKSIVNMRNRLNTQKKPVNRRYRLF